MYILCLHESSRVVYLSITLTFTFARNGAQGSDVQESRQVRSLLGSFVFPPAFFLRQCPTEICIIVSDVC